MSFKGSSLLILTVQNKLVLLERFVYVNCIDHASFHNRLMKMLGSISKTVHLSRTEVVNIFCCQSFLKAR